jgi:DNA mismatch endonuclease, patch repair protein
VDTLTKAQRSKNMARIGSKDTVPERAVRSLVHSMGYRFRLHRADLPGKPDLVFPARRKVIFVHGCFWHGHKCPRGRAPSSNTEFWNAKIAGNKKRDRKSTAALRAMGWSVLSVWQCETKNDARLTRRLRAFIKK